MMMVPKKLIYLITTLARGGTERNLVDFCENIDRTKYLPEVWYLQHCHNDFDKRLAQANIKTVCLNAPKRPNPFFMFKTAQRLARSDASLIHVFLPTVGYYASLSKFLFRCRIPMIYSCGGIQLLLPFQKQMMRFGIGRYCFPILCNSQAVFQFLTKLGISKQRLRIIPNGHRFEMYYRPLDRLQIRKHLDISADELLFISVGRLIDTKRHVDILHALALFDQQSPAPWKLMLVGTGSLESDLKNTAKSLKIQEHVIFAGHREDVVDLLRISDLCLFPSESEGLPNALIEASLAKLPIVATNIDAVADILESEQSAVLVPPRQPQAFSTAIQRFVLNRKHFGSLASNAFDLARSNYGIQHVMKQVDCAYKDAMSRTPPNH